MDRTVYDGLLDVKDHRDSFSPLLSEKGSISNSLLLTTLNIILLRKLASLRTFLVDLTYIWHRFTICMTLSYLVKTDSDYFENSRGGGGPLLSFFSPPPPTHTPRPPCRCIIRWCRTLYHGSLRCIKPPFHRARLYHV